MKANSRIKPYQTLFIRVLGLMAILSQSWALEPGQVETFEIGKVPSVLIHVSTSGSDTSGDGSAANPYLTIARGVQDAIPGTAVRIQPGVYPVKVNISNLSGTDQEPIWIGGVPGQAKPVIENATEGMHLTRVRYLIIHDLEVRNTVHNGINCDDGGDYNNPDATRHMVFRDLYIHDVGGTGNQDGLKLSGVDDFFVLDSEFARCGGGSSGSGVDQVGCHRGVIAGNYFHELSGNAVQCKGGSEDIEIRANRMVDFGARSVNMGGSTGFQYFRPPLSANEPNFEARNIRMVANVVERGVASLAFVGCVDCVALNNTIINPERWLIRILQETNSTTEYEFLPCSNNNVISNLFYFDRDEISTFVNIGPDTQANTFGFSNNLWYAHNSPAQSQPILPVTETGPVVGDDPMFANTASGDYRLLAGSPAGSAGKSYASPEHDFTGLPFRDLPSIGAYELDDKDPLIGGTPVDGLEDWFISVWFGTYNTGLAPWIYHAEHGYLYFAQGQTAASQFFYDDAMGAWWWTSESNYPYLYVFDPPVDLAGTPHESVWLYYFQPSRSPRSFGIVAGARAGGFLYFDP